MAAPLIFTYHCICSHLVLATTRDIFKLPRRQAPGLDGAIIVPLPPPPRSADSDNESEEDEDEEMAEQDAEAEAERMEIDTRSATDTSTGEKAQKPALSGKDDEEPDPADYTLLLSSLRDRKPCIIRREDGFEKRLLWRCGRCRLIFGYQIYDETLEELGKGRTDKRSSSKKNYFVYILPGGLTAAADMGSLTESDLHLLKEE